MYVCVCLYTFINLAEIPITDCLMAEPVVMTVCVCTQTDFENRNLRKHCLKSARPQMCVSVVYVRTVNTYESHREKHPSTHNSSGASPKVCFES